MQLGVSNHQLQVFPLVGTAVSTRVPGLLFGSSSSTKGSSPEDTSYPEFERDHSRQRESGILQSSANAVLLNPEQSSSWESPICF